MICVLWILFTFSPGLLKKPRFVDLLLSFMLTAVATVCILHSQQAPSGCHQLRAPGAVR